MDRRVNLELKNALIRSTSSSLKSRVSPSKNEQLLKKEYEQAFVKAKNRGLTPPSACFPTLQQLLSDATSAEIR
jgi:outer membrane translocation and assembly module TamA